MTKEELIELVRKISEAEFETEEQYNEAHDLFLSNVPDPEASRFIYNGKPSLTPKEIVEKALAYKPIILVPTDGKLKEKVGKSELR